MINAILSRVKTLLDLSDDSQDKKLYLYIENALFMVRSYINSQNVTGLEPIIAQLVCYLYTSSLEGATGQNEAGSSSSSGGGIEPVVGELKRESYSNVTFEYTTTSDFVNKSSSSSSQKATTSSGDPVTYFNSYICPLLRQRRHIVTLSNPLVEESPERY